MSTRQLGLNAGVNARDICVRKIKLYPNYESYVNTNGKQT